MNIVENSKIREQYIDLFRGIGILLMILVHVGFGWEIDKWARAFHMPMFFVVSGYFFKLPQGTNKKEILVNKIIKMTTKMLIPYAVFGVISYIVWLAIASNGSEMTILQPLKSLLWDNTRLMPISGSLWFLTAMWFSQLIFTILILLVPNKWVLLGLSGLFSIGAIIITNVGVVFPWSLNAALLGVFFISIGWHIRISKNGEKLLSKTLQIPIGVSLVMLLIFTITSFLNSTVNMRAVICGNAILFYVNALGLTIGFLNVCRVADQKITDVHVKKALSVIKKIGRNSITFLCLNQLIIYLMKKLLALGIPNLLFRQTVCLIVSVLLLILADWGIRNTKFRIILGEKIQVNMLESNK